MQKRPPIVHLLAIAFALAALAAGAWFYTNASDPIDGVPAEPIVEASPETPATPEACVAAGGVWNPCASACPPGAQACIQVCVERCEGVGDGLEIVDVYFPNSKLDPKHLDCAKVFPVKRAVDPKDAPKAALEALLKGPTSEELEAGYFTTLPDDANLNGLAVEGGVAHADFDAALNKVAGSCRVGAIRAQIEATLLQFPEIGRAAVSVDGNEKEALQP